MSGGRVLGRVPRFGSWFTKFIVVEEVSRGKSGQGQRAGGHTDQGVQLLNRPNNGRGPIEGPGPRD